jgi:hypothetical protein
MILAGGGHSRRSLGTHSRRDIQLLHTSELIDWNYLILVSFCERVPNEDRKKELGRSL